MGRLARTTRRGVQKDDDGVGGGYYITYSDHVVPLATHACTCMCGARADLLPRAWAVTVQSGTCPGSASGPRHGNHAAGALLSPYGYNRQAYIRTDGDDDTIELQDIIMYYGYNTSGVRLDVVTPTPQY